MSEPVIQRVVQWYGTSRPSTPDIFMAVQSLIKDVLSEHASGGLQVVLSNVVVSANALIKPGSSVLLIMHNERSLVAVAIDNTEVRTPSARIPLRECVFIIHIGAGSDSHDAITQAIKCLFELELRYFLPQMTERLTVDYQLSSFYVALRPYCAPPGGTIDLQTL